MILEVKGGPLNGTKKVLEPGGKIRVGRRARADLVVPDEQMSAPHFEISWDGTKCVLKDLKSKKGTHVGGAKVSRAELTNASWIRAGGSDFMVFFEAATPPAMDFDEALFEADEEDLKPLAAEWVRLNRGKHEAAKKARRARADLALAALQAENEPLYAVLDAARSDRIVTLLQESVEEVRSLYEGVEGETLAHVAPYLVSLPKGSRLLGRLMEEGWEKRWGIFLACPRPFKDVRTHFRRLLIVADMDTRERFYFRFYDPTVLRAFLGAATERQKHEIFGKIRAFYAEGELGEICRFAAAEEEATDAGD